MGWLRLLGTPCHGEGISWPLETFAVSTIDAFAELDWPNNRCFHTSLPFRCPACLWTRMQPGGHACSSHSCPVHSFCSSQVRSSKCTGKSTTLSFIQEYLTSSFQNFSASSTLLEATQGQTACLHIYPQVKDSVPSLQDQLCQLYT